MADKNELTKVFDIIIRNAIENSPVKSEIHIGFYKKDNNVIIYIKDYGPGIPENIKDKIFNRYEITLAIERKIGSGAGLLLTKYIVNAHNGSIWFKTEKDKGSTFFISLPLASIVE